MYFVYLAKEFLNSSRAIFTLSEQNNRVTNKQNSSLQMLLLAGGYLKVMNQYLSSESESYNDLGTENNKIILLRF